MKTTTTTATTTMIAVDARPPQVSTFSYDLPTA
jgi:hypothetical protein